MYPHVRGLSVMVLAVGCCLSLPSWAKGTGYVFVSSENDNVVSVLDGKTFEKIKDISTDRSHNSICSIPKYIIFGFYKKE